MPQSFTKRDDGGNLATDPDFDPLDNGFEVLESAAAAAHGSGQAPAVEPAPEPAPQGAPAGEGA